MNRIKTILIALLIMASVCATAAAETTPISDHGMKAYIWYADGGGWGSMCNRIGDIWSSQGFEVTLHQNPTPSTIYQTIADDDMKLYMGFGHGSDWCAGTGNGIYYAADFGAQIEEREYPLTMGVFQHCGGYLCYTPGKWLQESTQGNDDVVAQRFYGDGWCGNESGECEDCEAALEALSSIEPMGFGTDRMWGYLNEGYTYEDAVNKCSWSCAEGRKQGNKDLRYPQFSGDVNYDKVVDAIDVALLQNHINDPGTYPIHSDWDADVNGDGSVDSCDAMRLELHVGSPEAYQLYPRGWFASSAPPILIGDINCDCVVDYTDLGILGATYGLSLGDPGYNAAADLNGDDTVNYRDLGMLSAHYGEEC